ncbi:hypothetical protein M1293_01040 [Candidatus Parvarchaeota archaeon]|nr:hypothetical protein [Candidatus Parvarchaeota archaeon]
MIQNGFVLLGIFLVASSLVWVFTMVIAKAVSPRIKYGGMAHVAVESAERPLFKARTVGFQYFFYAIMFVVFEALFVLLFLWAEYSKSLGVIVFLGVGIAFVYMVLLIRYLMKNQPNLID